MIKPQSTRTIRHYFLAGSVSLATAIFILPFQDTLHLANIDMIFLLPVLVSSAWLGRGPAIFSVFSSVALFAYIYVPPHFSVTAKEPEFFIAFAIMMVVGLVTAELAAVMRRQTGIAEESARHSAQLYEVARDLAGVASMAQLHAAMTAYFRQLGLQAELLLLDHDDRVSDAAKVDVPLETIISVVEGKKPVEAETGANPVRRVIILPLTAPMRVRGVLVVSPGTNSLPLSDRDRDALRTMASLVGIAVERLHYVDVAQTAQLEMSSERLRSSVLTALSHDLRTPMTSIVGLADGLALSKEPLPESLRRIAEAISNRARAVNRLFDNLIKMAQLQSGRTRLKKEWHFFEDVIGSGLRLLEGGIEDHPVHVDIADDMPLVEFDAVLIERVICNLVENAAKYSPQGSPIQVRAFVAGTEACFSVRDHGPGFPPGPVEKLFGVFVRGEHETPRSGAGLGLAICHTIVEVHGGRLVAGNHPDGGALVEVYLPLGVPPEFDPSSIEKESV